MAQAININGNDITMLVESLHTDGWHDDSVVLIDGSLNRVLDGNHRVAAARHLGWSDTEIPTVDIRDIIPAYDDLIAEYCDDLTDEWQRAEAADVVVEQELLSNPALCDAWGVFVGH